MQYSGSNILCNIVEYKDRMSDNFDKNSFLFAANGDFVEDLYLKYIESPNNVDEYWRDFFPI